MAKKKRRVVSRKFYNQRSLHREREYGFYWYAWLWKLIRQERGLISSMSSPRGKKTG